MRKILTSNTGREFDVLYGSDEATKYTVSTIVPVYGADYTLRQALESLLDQDLGDDLEIVVVDDASPDGSRSIIDGYAAIHPNVTIVEHLENAGYGAAMNDGIQASRGEWIAILEPDDYLLPNMYKTMLEAAEPFGGSSVVDVVKTPYIRETRNEGVKRGDAAKDLLQCSYRHRIAPATTPFDMTDENAVHLLRHHPSIWSAIYAADFIRDEKIEFVEYPGAGWADNEFFYNTLLRAENIVYVDEPFYVYREETDHEFESFTLKNPDLAFDRWHSMADIIEETGSNDEGVLRSHISKGFTYLGGVIQVFGQDEPFVRKRASEMFARMDPDLVDKEDLVNPSLKKLYAELTGEDIDLARAKKVHCVELVKEAGYAVRNNGPAFMTRQVGRYLSSKAKRG